jgi:hypothetical protein
MRTAHTTVVHTAKATSTLAMPRVSGAFHARTRITRPAAANSRKVAASTVDDTLSAVDSVSLPQALVMRFTQTNVVQAMRAASRTRCGVRTPSTVPVACDATQSSGWPAGRPALPCLCGHTQISARSVGVRPDRRTS